MGRRQIFRPDPALEGIEQNLDPGAPLDDNCSDLTTRQLREIGIDLLPRTQLHALEAFEDDPLFDSVPGGFKAIYLQKKCANRMKVSTQSTKPIWADGSRSSDG